MLYPILGPLLKKLIEDNRPFTSAPRHVNQNRASGMAARPTQFLFQRPLDAWKKIRGGREHRVEREVFFAKAIQGIKAAEQLVSLLHKPTVTKNPTMAEID